MAHGSQVFRLIEHPLRTSVFAAQVQVGMWKRNGASVAHEAVNYASTSNRVLMADLDLTILQLGATRAQPDAFLAVFFERFGIQEWLGGPETPAVVPMGEDGVQPPPVVAKKDDVCESALVEECLVLLIQIISEQPRHPRLSTTTGLRRELLHRLCAVGDTGCSHSRLAECARIARRQTMVENDFFSAEEVDAEISGVAEFKENADPMQPGRYVLRTASVVEYDPHYFHLNRSEHEQARDWIESIRKKERDMDAPRSCVQPPNEPHEYFAASFRLFEASQLLAVWLHVLKTAVASTAPAEEEAVGGAESAAEARALKPQMTDGIVDATLQLITLAVHCQGYLPAAGDGTRRPFYEAMETDAPDGGPCLLLLLHALQTQIGEENPSLCEAIAWIVAHLVENDAGCEQRLRMLTGASSPTNKTSLEDRRKQLKQEAQKRAMADMQKMQMSFMAGMTDSSDESDNDEDEMVLSVPVIAAAGDGEDAAGGGATDHQGGGEEGEDDIIGSLPDCALSHEASTPDRLVGLMAFAQRSSVASGSPVRGGLYVHFYGHALHFDRYDNYYVSLVDKMERNEAYEGMHSIDVDRGEFLSPVCKSICNMLVPAVVNGREQVKTAAVVARESIGDDAVGAVAAWLASGFAGAFDGVEGERDASTVVQRSVDAGQCSAEHVVRMLTVLYELTSRPAAQKNVLTLLEVGSETIAYSIEATEMCHSSSAPLDASAAGAGPTGALWAALQLQQMRTMLDAVRAYAVHSQANPLVGWVRGQIAGLMQQGGAMDGGWCGIACSASAWSGGPDVHHRPSSLFAVGDVILIHGLQSAGAAPHNGKQGVVEGFDDTKGRFFCRIEGVSKVLEVKPGNLIRCCNSRVEDAPAHLLAADMLRMLAICTVYVTSRADLLHLARCFYVARLVQAALGPLRAAASTGDAMVEDEPVEALAVSCETSVLVCGIAGDDQTPPCALVSLREACLPFLRHAIMLVEHVALRLHDGLAPVGCSVEEEYAWCTQRLGLVAPTAENVEPELALLEAARPTIEQWFVARVAPPVPASASAAAATFEDDVMSSGGADAPSSPGRLMSGLRLVSPEPWTAPARSLAPALAMGALVGQLLVELPDRYDLLVTDMNDRFVETYGTVPDEPALCLVTGARPSPH